MAEWEPPARFVMTWHLVHRGWERLGGEAEDSRHRYGPGWDVVLERFVATSA